MFSQDARLSLSPADEQQLRALAIGYIEPSPFEEAVLEAYKSSCPPMPRAG